MAKKRKIPVRHHHGIRDPLKQLEERERKLKNVVNNPPEKDGEKQSRKFRQFKKLADDVKAGKKLPKRLLAGREDVAKPINKKKGSSVNKIKYVKQLPGEADVAYLKRINRLTSVSLREAHYEAKYGVTVTRNTNGEIIVEKKPKNEIDELLKQKEKQRLLLKRGKQSKKPQVEKPKMDPKTAKELIKQAFAEDKAEKRNYKQEEYQTEHIPFGEIVHAPPTINIIPRKAQKADTVPRPGKRNLLLTPLLKENSKSTKTSGSNDKPATQLHKLTKSNMKGKRKELPAGVRDMLEKERNKFVELYRNLKKPKQKDANTS